MTAVIAPDVAHRSLPELWSLRGRVAAVTGGANGIGEAIVRRLIEAGADVVIGDIDVARAEEVAAELNASGGDARVAVAPLDLRSAASVASFADACVERFGGLDAWVNNAAIFPSADLLSMDEAEWDDVIAVDLKGVWLGCREAARRMTPAARAGQAVIVNIEAMAAWRGRLSASHYVAAKHGVVGLTRALGAELGTSGIRVVGVAPTLTETPGVAARRIAAQAAAEPTTGSAFGFDTAQPLVLEERLRSTAPLGRNAVADDVARVVAFCASDMAALVTGSTIFVDAGVLAP